MIRAAAYARYSSDNQCDESIDAQLRAIHKFADENGYKIVSEYIDRAKTGTNDRREEFQRMIRDSDDGDFEVVIVHKLDRFARKRYDSAIYRKNLEENGVKLVSVLEQFTDSPEGIIFVGMSEAMSEYYSANLSREVKKGQYENAIACKHTGGFAPLGFRVNAELKYEINEEEAVHVRFIFQSILSGMNYSQIIEELNRRGVRTRRGREFGRNSLHEILRNEKYTGVYIYRRSALPDKFGKRNNHADRSRNDIIRIEGGVPQIISREVFDAVQAIMDKRKMEPYIRSDAKEVYLLSGKVFCGLCGNSYCGNRMHGGRNKSLYITYRCNSHSGKGTGNCRNKDVNRDYLENYIRKLLAEVLFDERRLEGVISEYNKMVNSNGSEYDSELRSVRSMIKKTKGEIDNLIGILAATGSASLAEAVSEREERLAMLKEKRREIESRRVTIETNREDIAEAFERGREMLLSGTIPHLRQLIQLYVSRIDVYPDHISATLNYLPALRAVGSDEAVGNYGAAAQNALEVREDIGREELNLECK